MSSELGVGRERDHYGSGQLEWGREKGGGTGKERRDDEDRSERLGKPRRETRQCEDGRRSLDSLFRRLDRGTAEVQTEEHISLY